jgi:hypothetical protein
MNEKPRSHVRAMSSVSLNGKVFPWHNDQPVFACLVDNPATFVPVFDDPDLLHANMRDRGIRNYTIKKIDDGLDFLASLEEGGVRVMLNPRQEGPKVVWTEVCSVDGAFERFTGHYFDADSLRLVIRQTPNLPPAVAETVIEAIEKGGAIKGDRGQYADVMEVGMIMATLIEEATQPAAKFFVRNVAAWLNDLDRLPIIKRPGDTVSGSN